MIKSFQGQRAAPSKDLPALKKVSDVMTERLITFSPDQSIFEAMDILVKKKISGGPVVDSDGNLCGVLSEGDCLKEIVRGKYDNSINNFGHVQDYMAKSVKTIAHDIGILEAANKFLDLRIRRFPVLKDGKLVGQISQKDVMKAVLGM